MDSITVSEYGTYGEYRKIVLNVKDDRSGVAKVQVAVWGTDYGQDDLTWYEAQYNSGSGKFEFSIYLGDHGDEGFIMQMYMRRTMQATEGTQAERV